MKLLIVESPNKIKKIKSFLGAGWDVKASVGHISDLAINKGHKGLGVKDTTSFEPIYEVSKDKKEVVKTLKSAVKLAETVYIATDPDREGEAIANHLKIFLKLKDYKRITFNEISKKAIEKAISAPGVIDKSLVDAQETRRIEDRFFGFEGSKIIRQASNGRLKSVGRVQSAGLKLIVDRENEIKDFVSTKYKRPIITINNLIFELKMDREEIIKQQWANVVWPKEIVVDEIVVSSKKVNPPKPLTTNDALKIGANLGFKPKETSVLLQKLFEQGMITYIRTDSNNVSDEFKDEAKKFIDSNNDITVAADISRIHPTKDNAQEGHESIRPVHINDLGNSITNPNEKIIYDAIYKITLASQLESGVDTIQEIKIKVNEFTFINSSKVVKSLGFRKYYGYNQKTYSDVSLEKGTYPTNIKLMDKATVAPSRYTEISFLGKLEASGIGRPSTFASILQTVLDRKYASLVKKKMVPTSNGFEVVAFLEIHFKEFIAIDFTKKMEDDLDLIHKNQKTKIKVLSEFNTKLETSLDSSTKTIELQLSKENGNCPKCERPLRRLNLKTGEALGCSNYPTCKHFEWLNSKKKN